MAYQMSQQQSNPMHHDDSPGEAVADIDGDGALDWVQGGPVLGCWDGIPDVANLVQVWVFVNVLAWRNLQAHISCEERTGF